MRAIGFMVVLAACGDGGSSGPDANLACTPEARQVTGTAVAMGASGEYGDFRTCMHALVRNSTELMAAFGNSVPPQFANVDFAVDRILLGQTNPGIRYVVDDGATLVVGEQAFCQGAAPMCTAVILHSTRDTMMIDTCPYVGPNPCLAP